MVTDKDKERALERQAKLRAKTRRNRKYDRKYGHAPPQGMGRIKCEICGKPLSKHNIVKLCNGM